MREVLVMASLPEREWLPLALLWSRCHDIGLAIAVQFCAVFRRQAGMNGRRSDCPTTGSPHIPAMRKLPVVLFCRIFSILQKSTNQKYSPAIPPRHEGRSANRHDT